MEDIIFLGLPLKTWIIVGGLYMIATFLPSIFALILRRKEARKTNE